ncbi:MAG: hypothetical protein HC912_04765 [Saprospiraceae bacterium]|nr:hypothetical protein [Saprospiraceae bacterium]
MINRNYWIAALLNLLLLWACASEQKGNEAIAPDQLVGRWEVQQATRSGRPTETLGNLYFEFTTNGTMETNLPTAEGQSEYQLTGNLIQQKGATSIEYTIESLSESAMVLKNRTTKFRISVLFNEKPLRRASNRQQARNRFFLFRVDYI